MSNPIEDRLHVLFSDCENAGPVSAEEISAAELELSVVFPPSYRMFLAKYGASWFRCPYSIAGICDEPEDVPPLHESVVRSNLQLRRRGRHILSLIKITDDGTDWSLFLDTACVDQVGECPVIVLGPGKDGLTIANSFIEFCEIAVLRNPLENEN